jgi:hypothetical protein
MCLTVSDTDLMSALSGTSVWSAGASSPTGVCGCMECMRNTTVVHVECRCG